MQWADRIGRRLKLRDLHIFLAVVQHKSMVKAGSRNRRVSTGRVEGDCRYRAYASGPRSRSRRAQHRTNTVRPRTGEVGDAGVRRFAAKRQGN